MRLGPSGEWLSRETLPVTEGIETLLVLGLDDNAVANVARRCPLLRALKLMPGEVLGFVGVVVARRCPLLRALKPAWLRRRRHSGVSRETLPVTEGIETDRHTPGGAAGALCRETLPVTEGIETRARRSPRGRRRWVARRCPLLRALKLAVEVVMRHRVVFVARRCPLLRALKPLLGLTHRARLPSRETLPVTEGIETPPTRACRARR